MAIKKKSKVSTEIPTASMPDIVFMLLLFFMVTTVFRQSTGLEIELPSAKKIEKLEAKKNVVSIWANADKDVSIDDKLIDRMGDINLIMAPKVTENSRIIVSMKIDKAADMGLVTDIQQELRKSNALRVNYTAKYGD
ncbi:biopolymer transporter ExbD [bacterium]|nr:biopolymer transporter ExbD [bacterium]